MMAKEKTAVKCSLEVSHSNQLLFLKGGSLTNGHSSIRSALLLNVTYNSYLIISIARTFDPKSESAGPKHAVTVQPSSRSPSCSPTFFRC